MQAMDNVKRKSGSSRRRNMFLQKMVLFTGHSEIWIRSFRVGITAASEPLMLHAGLLYRWMPKDA